MRGDTAGRLGHEGWHTGCTGVGMSSRSLALGLLLLSGCSGKVIGPGPCGDPPPPSGGYCPPAWECVDGQWVDTAGACPEPACPELQPSHGDACQLNGQVCTYWEDVPCGPSGTVTATCQAGAWSVVTPYCSPEPTCPAAMPEPGTDCSAYWGAFACDYPVETPCGASSAILACDDAGLWALQVPAASCDCALLDVASCDLVQGCQWLEPGCGDAPIAAGCYPTVGCNAAESCPLDTACVEKSFDPCVDATCDACGASYWTCEPTMGGA